jgi:hypothetical protein
MGLVLAVAIVLGSFFLVVATCAVTLGATLAFMLAICAALLAVALSSRMLKSRSRP